MPSRFKSLCLAIGSVVTPLAALAAQSREVARASFPPAIREELFKGLAVRLTPTVRVTVRPSGNSVTLRIGELVAARTGTKPVLRRTQPSTRDSGGPAAGADSVFAVPFSFLTMDPAGVRKDPTTGGVSAGI